MVEAIGILVIWLICGALVSNGVFILVGWWADTGEGASDAVLGAWVGVAALAVYVIATVVYLVVF
jgi:hypothetical protein